MGFRLILIKNKKAILDFYLLIKPMSQLRDMLLIGFLPTMHEKHSISSREFQNPDASFSSSCTQHSKPADAAAAAPIDLRTRNVPPNCDACHENNATVITSL